MQFLKIYGSNRIKEVSKSEENNEKDSTRSHGMCSIGECAYRLFGKNAGADGSFSRSRSDRSPCSRLSVEYG
ncbi:hypothetical protein D3C75_615170 [compost metagenome]